MDTTDPDPRERDPIDEIDASARSVLGDALLWHDPTDLEDRIVAAVASEFDHVPLAEVRSGGGSRLRSVVFGAAAAIVALFAGVVVFSALDSPTETDVLALELVPTGVVGDIGGSIDLVEWESGLRIDLDAPGLPRRDEGTYYEAWVRTVDGQLVPVGTFHSGTRVTLWAGVGLADVTAFSVTMEEMTDATNDDQASSGEVVLKADVSEP